MSVRSPKSSTAGRRRVEFRLDRPMSKAVSVAGDFNGWDVKVHPMRQNDDGVWTKAVMVFPGRYEYRFYADGQWCNDPRSASKCENCFGTQNDYIVVAS